MSSVLNVVAGGGSFLTLPILIFLGMPAGEANGTNRVGVLAQNLGAVWSFHRARLLDWRWALAAAVPAGAGGVLGAFAALHVGDRDFKRILSVLMLALTLWTLLDPLRRARPAARSEATSPLVAAGFLLVGLYGGFVQAGVGFLVLAVTTLAGLDLVRGNAIKVLAVLLLTVLSLPVFAAHGRVDWLAGAALGGGSLAGGVAGVRLTVLKGHRWLQRAVSAAVVAFAVLLWFS